MVEKVAKNKRINMALTLTLKQMTSLIMFWEDNDQSQEHIPTTKVPILILPLNFTLAPVPELPKVSYFIF